MKTINIQYHLYEYRMQKHLTERKLSELSGISKSEINSIENNMKDPTVRTLCLLSLALDISPDKLFSMEVIV